MKNIAYFLIAAGFLIAAYATSLDAQQVNWNLFAAAAAAAIVGVWISKRQDGADARSESTLKTNLGELTESISNIVIGIDNVINGSNSEGEPLRNWIDEELRPDLRRFADARESMIHLFSLQTYADIMSEFATGERYINRVWSASADGYNNEARTYLGKAMGQFRDAQSQLESVSR
jgi:hypothetical protein